jgi:hypothetical protein
LTSQAIDPRQPAASRSWSSRPRDAFRNLTLHDVLFAACVGLLLLPVWTNEYFLTQDGPMHLHNARILLDHITSRGVEQYGAYYQPNIHLFPYWVGHLSLALLLTIASPAISEKLLSTAYIVLFAYGLRHLIRALNPRAVDLAFLGLPLIWGRPFQMGFVDFSFSNVVLLFALLFYIRHRESMTRGRVLGLSLLFLALYFCHPTTYIFGVLCVGCLFLLDVIRQVADAGHWRASGLAALVHARMLALALFPSAMLLAVFLQSAPSYSIARPRTFWPLLLNFLRQSNLATLSTDEALVAPAVPLLLLVLFAVAARERLATMRIERHDGFFLAALTALAMHLYGSRYMFGFFERMQFLPLLMLLLWLAAGSLTVVRRRLVVAVSVAVVVALVGVRYPRQAFAASVAAEYGSAVSTIAPHSTVLALTYDYFGRMADGAAASDYLKLFLHAPEYLGASDRSLIMLNNIGGLYPMYPYLWRGDRNPFVHLESRGGIEGDPPSADILAYSTRTGGTVDYVILLGLGDSRHRSHPDTLSTLRQLRQGYTLVFTSANGRASLYKATAPSGPARN